MQISATTSTNRVTSATHELVKTGSGEFTAASVAAHPSAAAELIKLKNGNYATPIVPASDRAATLESAVIDLKFGGS